MGQIRRHWLNTLFLYLFTIALAGCSKPATLQPASDGPGYTSALDTAYEGAPDVTTLLALGTLRLQDSEDAVGKEQAARLLPLWKSLQGSALQNDAERNAAIASAVRL